MLKNKQNFNIMSSIKLLENFLLLLTITLSSTPSDASDTINATQIITDNDHRTLTSSDGSFELGFFSPGNSKNRYVGIWYKQTSNFPVAWVANRDNPLENSTGAALKLAGPGNNLVLLDGNNTVVWSTNYTSRQKTPKNPILKLLDSGNLVIKEADDESPENYLWQSFDHPTDTLFPGMKLGWNFITGKETVLTSWKSGDDPGSGDYTFRLEITGFPQLVLKRNGDEVYRTGSWNGEGFNGVPGLKKNGIYEFGLVNNKQEAYYHYDLVNNAVKSRFVLNYTGIAQRWTWADKNRGWAMYLNVPTDNCDYYNECRGYGICNVANSPVCDCLDKFVPRSPDKWRTTDWSDGCVRRKPTDCKTDGFVRYTQMKLPDENFALFRVNSSLRQCEEMCLRNCSCAAYASLDVTNGGSGCLLWSGALVDVRRLYGAEREIFIRMASSELRSENKKKKVLIGTLSALAAVFSLGIFVTLFVRRRKRTRLRLSEMALGHHSESHHRHEDMDLPLFDLSTVTKATNSFSPNNKLGEGGFGPVYKGVLENRQEIAVKRLSKTSMQGLDEFKNEVIFIAKLQHRNLVKLFGCCIQGTEKMLVYEYLANRSLDLILFDPTANKTLDWAKRFQIITGIARGLMYLHQDSRLRIVHRDLKTSNILLDSNMNPKISDFGMARTFGGNDVEGNTSRVVGTYGYMSPEYVIDGMFSVKSDVFSFGVIVLEILSGKRNRAFVHADHHHNLLGHGWLLYKEGRAMDMIDGSLGELSFNLSDVLKALHVGLLCVQQNPEERPSMSSVVFMLENDVVLPQPKEPGFFTERNFFATDTSFSTHTLSSANDATMTLPEAR